MKSFSLLSCLSARLLLLSSVFWIGACGENSRQAKSADATEAGRDASAVKEEGEAGGSPNSDGQIAELRREIESGRQNIQNLDAFVQMERAKVENDPDYDPSFLLDALNEQQQIREDVELGEKRLQELSSPDE